MKKTRFLFLIFLAVLASCSTKESAENTEATTIDFSYEIDTVEIDPGEHLIYITSGMRTAAVSTDKKILYNLNPDAPELELIDLEALAYKESLPLELEGPEGIGMNVSDFAVSEKEDFIFQSYQSFIKANSKLDHFKSLKFQSEYLSGDTLKENEVINFYFGAIYSKDGDHLFATYSEQGLGAIIKGLAIVDLQTMALKKVPIPELESLVDFNITRTDENGIRWTNNPEQVWLIEANNKIYLTHTVRNEAFIYDLKAGSLSKKTFHSILTADAKVGQYIKNTNSREEMRDAWAEKNKEVEFNTLIFDDTNRKFWRESQDLDHMIGDMRVMKSVLTVFDENLNQLHEQELDFSISEKMAFFKDGSLYSYINLEDELGFVRIKPSYE
ncbi:protein of unknown function [Algoriphagus locisalis]|uniref:TolB-like 6-blade propeller-like n=1 Tax=Algoriphagus locisalis TaxID=305507 RepID=A0A1I7ANV3_9BACT|nr:DUF4221 family protein [Algoriphagus locisalis]SFT76640.1 protein of unknown function [Algoriphagus locisalis]